MRGNTIVLLIALAGCSSGGADERSENEHPKTPTKCSGLECKKSVTGVDCVDNAVNIASITEQQAVRLCRSGGRRDLYICYVNAVKIGKLTAEDAIDLCDTNNINSSYLCYLNGVNLAKLSHAQALALCDNEATDEGYLCVNNGKSNVNGMTTDQAITLCRNGADTDAYICVLKHQTQSALSVDEAISLCSITIKD